MGYIDQNINLLSANINHWIGEYKENIEETQLIKMDEDGKSLFFVNNKLFNQTRSFDEKQKPNNLKRELIFVIGIYSLEEIKQVFRTMSKESVLVIIEPNKLFFVNVLHNEDLSIFKYQNVLLFADSLNDLPFFLDNLFSTSLIYYVKNIRFYFTDFYRSFGEETSKTIIRKITETVKYKAMVNGNSIEDSLIGFRHNMKNIKQLSRSKNVSSLKGIFGGKPAIVVAAGPSLNKNINHLKKMKNKAILIAVDTIASRLIQEGIVPDFICSIEREKDTYTYFYENKYYPREITLVGPLLLYPKIFDEFEGDIVIPMRENVGEYVWLQDALSLHGDNAISVGLSCAHVAFGFAEHIGASPIILVGQDLAFGTSMEDSHAEGTIYDDKKFTNNVFSDVTEIKVKGYYGNEVSSTDTWVNFRKWFEGRILNKQLFVINATEGGASIANTIQKDLADVIKEYCHSEIIPVKEVINSVDSYPLTPENIKQSIEKQKTQFQQIKVEFEKQLNLLKRLKIHSNFNEKKLLNVLNKLQVTDQLFQQVKNNWLLRHNLQPIMITTIWGLFEIEQVLSVKNLERNKEIQIEFLTVSVFVIGEILAILEDCLGVLN